MKRRFNDSIGRSRIRQQVDDDLLRTDLIILLCKTLTLSSDWKAKLLLTHHSLFGELNQGTFAIGESITLQLTSCLTDMDLTNQLNLLFIHC